jgi:hypothetical protein
MNRPGRERLQEKLTRVEAWSRLVECKRIGVKCLVKTPLFRKTWVARSAPCMWQQRQGKEVSQELRPVAALSHPVTTIAVHGCGENHR